METPSTTTAASRLLALAAVLRAGRYEQGKGSLRETSGIDNDESDKFCCLGVGCDLYGEAREELGRWENGNSFFVARYPGGIGPQGQENDTSCSIFPEPVARYYGLDKHGLVNFHEGQIPEKLARKIEDKLAGRKYHRNAPHVFAVELYELNDAGFSFEEIATVIEAHAKRECEKQGLEVPEPAEELTKEAV